MHCSQGPHPLLGAGSLAPHVGTSISERSQDEGNILRALSCYPVESFIWIPVGHFDSSYHAIAARFNLLDPFKSVSLVHQGLRFDKDHVTNLQAF